MPKKLSILLVMLTAFGITAARAEDSEAAAGTETPQAATPKSEIKTAPRAERSERIKTAFEEVNLSPAGFKPVIKENLKPYDSKGIVVYTFKNDAGNTRRNSFESEYGAFSYTDPDQTLGEFMLETMRKYARKMGMEQYEGDSVNVKVAFVRVRKKDTSGVPSGTPFLYVTLNAMSDSRVRAEVEIRIDDIGEIKKSFTVTMDDPPLDDVKVKKKMADRAYAMLNQLYATIFSDEEVMEVFKEQPAVRKAAQSTEEETGE